MAGLNNLLSDTQQTTTTMPAWYDQAQQAIVNQGLQAASAAPTMANTTSQQAINTLQGGNNPFTQAQGTLQQISSGAANPWIVGPNNQVTPNTATALGGLFQAENQQLNQLMPNYTAVPQAAAIGSGNFGSLRGQTAVNKAAGDAFTTLTAQQMAAALQNQQTGQAAAANLGNVGSQGINSAMNVGIAQQNSPFQNVGNLATLLGTLQAPTTVQSQKQLSGLGQATAIGNALSGGLTALGNTAAGKSLLSSLGLAGLVPGSAATVNVGGGSSTGAGGSNAGSTIGTGNATGTDITGTGSIGDVASSMPYLQDGVTPNPNYDAYADPNATQAQIDAQNALYNEEGYNPIPAGYEDI